MSQFTTLTSKLIPLPNNDVDTDQIIPARFMKITDKNGLAANLFFDWRYNADGTPKADFVLNMPQHQGSNILVAGDNFGCGSSREHAPWSLTSWGIRAIFSTSFADIFKGNALKNGLLPIEVSPAVQESLLALTEEAPSATVHIDLASQSFTLPDGSQHSFGIDPFAKICLLNGVDQLGYIQSHEAKIAAFEMAH
ncbi:MAG TPA: 3-isopropylmalate dehydratase small subunit [Anaerolineales bacterium]|nr:3-isopropylmalate dehydratase small subunit [Anaerolineales bacterium]